MELVRSLAAGLLSGSGLFARKNPVHRRLVRDPVMEGPDVGVILQLAGQQLHRPPHHWERIGIDDRASSVEDMFASVEVPVEDGELLRHQCPPRSSLVSVV